MTTTPPTDLCNGKTADGLCPFPAGHRTPHPGIGRCSRHGGSTPSGRAAALYADLDRFHADRYAARSRQPPTEPARIWFDLTPDPELWELLSRHSVPPDR